MASGREAAPKGNNGVLWKDRKHFMWFPFSFTKYSVRNGRIYIEKGLFSSTSDQTLLYRITDIQLRRSFSQKIYGTGTVALISNIDAEPHLLLENIKNPKKVYDLLSNLVEDARAQKNVIGKEFYARGGHDCTHMPATPPPMPAYSVNDVDMDGVEDMMDEDQGGSW